MTMKPKKLTSVAKLSSRVIGYVSYIEENRKTLKGLPGNSKSILADLAHEAHAISSDGERVDKLEREFLAERTRVKERTAALDTRYIEQLNYAREFAKRRRLTVVRDQL